ncbi:MAG TPA: MarR family transcriptional regulator [Bacillota bacterium]|nr:MarR family transcriptional regulator [Bacillota bacterium]HOB86309.1 MarR family transcriptional regulator [Bacillota bacterium]HOP69610.1 MarR family transcriptional regulator [Bacillota bacterium]HPT34687.1 MarR family transcriptional regulator [Bacillota bacterium]HPZ64983.1 MarR family transcriptional regulator [Bacillota bacterium]
MPDFPLGRWISLLYRYGQIYISRELEPYRIGRGQYLFLLVLYQRDGLLQEELSCYLNIDKGTTARAIDRLEEAGYVRRVQNSEDLRSNRVYLTPQAEEVKPVLFSVLKKWTEILSQGLTPEEMETAQQLLSRMSENAFKHIHGEGK